MADKRLTYVLTARDDASLVFKKVATEAEASNKRIGDSGEKASKQLHLLSTAAVTLAPAIIPIAVGAAGAVAGLGGVAGAALLSFKGLTDQWKQGTLQAQPLGQQITSLLGNLKGMESISATAISPGLTDGLKKINADTPALTTIFEKFSGQLGQIASHVGPGLVQLFIRLSPLFDSVGNELVKGSVAFEKWAGSSTSVTKFVTYAQQELPHLENTIKNIVTLALRLVQGAAPLGGGSFRAIEVFSSLLSKFPVGVLQVIVPLIAGLKVAGTVSAGVSNLAGAFGKLSPKVAASTVEMEAATTQTGLLATAMSTALIPAIAGVIGGYILLNPVLDKVSGNTHTFSDQLNTLRGKTLDAIPPVHQLTTGFQTAGWQASDAAAKYRIATGTTEAVGGASDRAAPKVHALSGALDGVPRHVAPTISVSTGAAMTAIQSLKDQLAQLPNSQTIRVELDRTINTFENTTYTRSGLATRAAGGPVQPGVPYLIGESGPEIMIPATAGTVVPNSGPGRTAAVGDNVYINVNVSPMVGASPQAVGAQIASALRENLRSRGKTSMALQL